MSQMFGPNKNSIYIDGRIVSIEQYIASLNNEDIKDTTQDTNEDTTQDTVVISLEELREAYKQIHNKEVPNNKKNDTDWILSKVK